jgi:hypothetical protein
VDEVNSTELICYAEVIQHWPKCLGMLFSSKKDLDNFSYYGREPGRIIIKTETIFLYMDHQQVAGSLCSPTHVPKRMDIKRRPLVNTQIIQEMN